ncbi:hypothetical protein DJ73_03010 [Halorubrum sp. Ea1]|uniref:hypothetical protein n=1 Tax=Halorubrum sp. Ea1 TaxID=1480718 RepID=UPI000B99BECC|nr:hypothetical protein [Halorubrum sp. Ea1]OYR55070.1 hypothetical protein DJ73_03010 [Halorubrum sp. Ea1]
MALQTTFDVLSTLVGNQQSRGRSVRNVEATTDGSTLRVDMEVLVPLRSTPTDETDREPTVEATSLTDDGGLAVELTVPELVPLPTSTAATVEVSGRTVEVTHGALEVDLDLTIDPPAAGPAESEGRVTGDAVTDGNGGSMVEHARREAVTDAVGDVEPAESNPSETDPVGSDPAGGDSSESDPSESDPSESDPSESDLSESGPSDGVEAVRDESMPPYEDVEYLRALYAECDTFSEMRDAIAMDVSAETVRRYMIDAGVHEPTAYETATTDGRTDQGTADGPSERDEASERDGSPVESSSVEPSTEEDSRRSFPDAKLVADGIGLPDDVEIGDVIESVVRSSTVYEVRRDLDLDDGYARELLDQLDLLDLVMCRLSKAPDREVTYEEAAARVRQCTTASG